MVVGDVVALGEVVGEVEEGPVDRSAKSRLPSSRRSSSTTPFDTWSVVAFHPSWTIERRAEHLEVLRVRGARRAPRRRTWRGCYAPSTGCCATPSTASGASTPAASSTVGMRSIACTNWSRTSPRGGDAVAASGRRAACACRRATCSASTAAAACCRPTPSPTSSGGTSGGRRARRSARGCPRRCRARAR